MCFLFVNMVLGKYTKLLIFQLKSRLIGKNRDKDDSDKLFLLLFRLLSYYRILVPSVILYK